MSYGAPCERGVGAADTMPLRDMEVPGLIPDVGEVELAPKEARRGRQRDRRQRRREETASRRERSLVDRDRCFGVIAEAVDSHRQELKVISRGLDLCESTLCSDVAEMRTWVTSALEEQQKMMLRVMGEVVKLGKAIEGSRRARGAEGKIVEEGGEFSGGYGVQEAPRCVFTFGEGQWAPPTLAAISGRAGKVAVEKAIGGASVHTGSASTVSTVLWGSRADVDDRAGSDGDGGVEAAGEAAATIWEETGSEGYEGSSEGCWEEFTARSDGGFEATRPAEAEGDGDVWCAATVTAAAPADMAGTAIFPGVADDAGASEGVSRDSGAVVAPEIGRSWTDVGGFDQDEICIVGGDRCKTDREELAGGGTETTGAEEIDTEVPAGSAGVARSVQ